MSDNTIRIKCYADRREEALADAALSPGHLLMKNSTNEVLKNTATTQKLVAVAIEDYHQGKTIDDAYSSGDVVSYIHPMPGDVVQLRVAAAEEAIVIGDALQPKNDGTVEKGTTNPIAYAEEAVDNSAGGSEVFIKARIA
jgi:hypothetical protein